MARNVALLIGNTEYDHLSSLKCCANDVAQMHRLLLATQKFSQIVGFVDQPIALVTDEIRRISEADEGTEEVFLFFSGHGVSNSDDFYMCFKGFQESAPNTTGLSRAETYELIRMFSAKQSVVVIDACEAGRNIIKNDVPPLARALKSGFTDFVQFSSCTENQNSQGGDWVSVFTDEFIKSCLKKERGPIYYLDVENALRDAFLSNSEQTPHFIRQGTSQEKFCNDACRLDEFRKTYLARIDNDSEQVEAESIGSSFASAKAAIEDIDAQVPAKKSAQAFIDEVFQTTLKKSELTPELSDFFEARTVQYDTFEHVGNLRSVVNLLARRGGSDSFVESVVERKRRRPISLYDYSAWASLGMLAEYDETYDLLCPSSGILRLWAA